MSDRYLLVGQTPVPWRRVSGGCKDAASNLRRRSRKLRGIEPSELEKLTDSIRKRLKP